ncbi:MAG: hypothetical protein SD837_10840 [Candidatus Electrothrix scaldis]|nr:MAG: hypothetical protein SD837_10840 [Candidatus Electrothrix sp. GW3-3]
MTKLKRKYSQRTLKILFGLSGNQCAYPECTNPVIQGATEKSEKIVLNEICHIYALNEDGPRGRVGLTEKELNAYENLILFCPTHHVIVDKQHESYSADLLKDWKQSHESKMQKLLSADTEKNQFINLLRSHLPTELIDQKIKDEIDLLRKSRFFQEFDTINFSLKLSEQLVNGQLSGGNDTVRCHALAWCSRVLSLKELEQSEYYLSCAQQIGNCLENDIAKAFVLSKKKDKSSALSILADIGSPASRSAALIIVAQHDGPQGALDWLSAAELGSGELSSDGKVVLLSYQLQLAQWDHAKITIDSISDDDLRDAPVLYRMMAVTYLVFAVPDELRFLVLQQVPFHAAEFPLSADHNSLNARRIAHGCFLKASLAAQQLNLSRTAIFEDQYALWLELKNPDTFVDGRERLKSKLRDLQSALHLVPLALQFGITLDINAVEREIGRLVALYGKITHEAAVARFALTFTRKTPEDAANYISRHYDDLVEYIDEKSIQCLQVELLSQAGFSEKATRSLEDLLNKGLTTVEESRLRRIIAEAEGKIDSVEAKKEQFRQTDSLSDLILLVDELEKKGGLTTCYKYPRILFEKTHSVRDAERLAEILYQIDENEQLVELLKENAELVDQSKKLQLFYCWSLYDEGALLDARTELKKMADGLNNPNYRALHFNLCVALGDWNSLSAIVANEYQEKDNRTAQELLEAARLAFYLAFPNAKELVFAAVEKSPENAEILAAAYFLASSAGWENDDEVSQWFQKSINLSDDNGPIQRATLKDLLDQKPDWERREDEIWNLLSRGEIPIFQAAQALNKSLVGLILLPALANLSESDPRRRGIVPAYSGKRQLMHCNIGRSIAIEKTALLTLSFLDLLEKTFDAFEEVWIPHSTLAWLFEEKQKVVFHQPSRIERAHKIHDLLARGILEKFIPSTTADSILSDQVGIELAALITEAERSESKCDTQRIVVRSAPIYRAGSLMVEQADLTEHADVVSGCLALVEKLRQQGQITAKEEKNAQRYLYLHEKPWSHQPEISDGAVLYLDNLSVSYLFQVGILEKLQPAGFRVIVSPEKVSDANELIAYESISGKINETIERIRAAVSSRIETGKIKLGRRCPVDMSKEQSLYEHPTLGVMSLAKNCDAIISDDRSLNQYGRVDDASAQVPILSSFDLIDFLVSEGLITIEDQFEYRTLLRRAGYYFTPVTEDELIGYLADATIKNDKIVETAELKAIRENILRTRMSSWLQLPGEVPWLHNTIKVFINVLKRLWTDEADFLVVTIQSNWILAQIDVRGWAHCLESENGDNLVNIGRGAYIQMLLRPLPEWQQTVKEAYWKWAESEVLAPVKQQSPDLYAWIISWQKRMIVEMASMKLPELGENGAENSFYVKSTLAQSALEMCPPLICSSLFDDISFIEQYGITVDAILSFSQPDISMQRSELFSAVRKAFSGTPEVIITDNDDQEWKVTSKKEQSKLPVLRLASEEHELVLSDFAVFSQEKEVRLQVVDEAEININFPSSEKERWRNILSKRPLKDDEYELFQNDLRNTPVEVIKQIRHEIRSEESFKMSSLVPPSREYFERLIGEYDDSISIKDYAVGAGKRHFEQLSAWRSYEGVLFSLLLASHSSLSNKIAADHLSNEELVNVFGFLEKHGDRLAQLGAVEIGLRILAIRPGIEPFLVRIIKQMRDDDIEGASSEFKLFSALFIFVDAELSRIRLFSEEPPFYRRLAALAQAALVQRQFIELRIDIESFCTDVLKDLSGGYYLQSLIDVRSEPRWYPDFADPSQIKNEFISRVSIAANKYKENINNGELHNLLFGSEPTSISSYIKIPQSFFPGPLEGYEDSPNLLPADLSERIESQLNEELVEPTSFFPLVNLALVFHLDSHHAQLAAEALKRSRYLIANLEDSEQLFSVLNGVATVAAVSRSRELADELRIIVRRYRYDAQYSLVRASSKSQPLIQAILQDLPWHLLKERKKSSANMIQLAA